MVRFLLFLTSALALLYIWKVRPWMRTWGTQGDEATGPLPGDEVVREAMGSYTRAININAPPRVVFPWLVQMGLGRGGFYSYDALDNEGKPSVTSIVPELQNLKVGELPYFYLLFEWVDFVMNRKQLLGIKQRAEQQYQSSEVSNARASRAQE